MTTPGQDSRGTAALRQAIATGSPVPTNGKQAGELAKPTPGEWIVKDGEQHDHVFAAKPPHRRICGVYGGLTSPEGLANARLIAASPAMYAAIVGLLNAIHDSMLHESQRFHADEIAAAYAALAQVEGKQ